MNTALLNLSIFFKKSRNIIRLKYIIFSYLIMCYIRFYFCHILGQNCLRAREAIRKIASMRVIKVTFHTTTILAESNRLVCVVEREHALGLQYARPPDYKIRPVTDNYQ